MGYNRDRKYWEKWFPADFITESFPGQFRNWFYAILAMSTMMEQRAPMKVLLGHGLVLDERGETMSKSKVTPSPSTRPPTRWGPTSAAGFTAGPTPLGTSISATAQPTRCAADSS